MSELEKVTGEVVMTNGMESSVENVIATIEPKATEMKVPVIELNYEELTIALDGTLAKYQDYEVTEENLDEAKKLNVNLSKLKSNIDDFRLSKKKELTAPITAFEKQCKALIEKVEDVKKPVNSGVAVFNQKQREERKAYAQKEINTTIEKYGIRSEYAGEIIVIDSYLNSSTTKKSIRADIEEKVLKAKEQQDAFDALLVSVQTCIDMENQRINTKLSMDDFNYMIKQKAGLDDIMTEIRKRADKIVEAEKPKEPEPVEEIVEEPVKAHVEETKEVFAEQVQTPKVPSNNVAAGPFQEVKETEPQYYVEFVVQGKFEALRNLQKYMDANGIKYDRKKQGKNRIRKEKCC